MKKSWGLTRKILSGEKKIESRWYKLRRIPWDTIQAGETVYFKNSGEPISLRTEVESVLQFANLTPEKVKAILYRYGAEDGIEKESIPDFFERFKHKRYCILVFLKNPTSVEPFEIDKTGFGTMAPWITVADVSGIMKKRRFDTQMN